MQGRSIPRDLLILLSISIPLLLVAGVLFVAGEYLVTGWDGLSLALYGVAVLGVWAVLVLCLCAWIVLRDGIRPSGILPAMVLAIAFGGAGIWGGLKFLEQRRCEQSADFFARIATASPADRETLIEMHPDILAEPTWCGFDAVQYWFGLDHEGRPVAPGGDADRLAALRRLLAAGLMPDERLMRDAARGGDAAAIALYAEFRLESGIDPWPLRPAVAALQGYEYAPDDAPRRPDHLTTLRLFVEGGADVCSTPDNTVSLAVQMDRLALPWREWALPDDASRTCGETFRP